MLVWTTAVPMTFSVWPDTPVTELSFAKGVTLIFISLQNCSELPVQLAAAPVSSKTLALAPDSEHL